MIEVLNTTDWPLHKIAPYLMHVGAALQKVVDRFPEDVSLDQFRADVFAGRQSLWIMLEDGEFRAAALTETKVVAATGNKCVVITDLGGECGEDLVPWIEKIEEYARSIGAHDVRAVGRLGWRRALKREGYELMTCFYRKAI